VTLSEYLDGAQAALYTATTLAVVVGGFLALRRYRLEEPHAPSWGTNLGDCKVRAHPEKLFVYDILVTITNQSKSSQRISCVRFAINFDLLGTPEERLYAIANKSPQWVTSEVPPGGVFRFSATTYAKQLHEIVDLTFVLETERRRFVRGYTEGPPIRVGRLVNVSVDDLNYLRGSDT
jgi:hypothetical protein